MKAHIAIHQNHFLPIRAKEIAKLTATELLPSPLLGLVTPIHFESPPAMENATFVLNDLYASCTLNGEFCERSNVSPFIAGTQFQALKNNKIREKSERKSRFTHDNLYYLYIFIYAPTSYRIIIYKSKKSVNINVAKFEQGVKFVKIISHIHKTPAFCLGTMPILSQFICFLQIRLMKTFHFEFITPVSQKKIMLFKHKINTVAIPAAAIYN